MLNAQFEVQAHNLPHLVCGWGLKRRSGEGFDRRLNNGRQTVNQRAIHIEREKRKTVIGLVLHSSVVSRQT